MPAPARHRNAPAPGGKIHRQLYWLCLLSFVAALIAAVASVGRGSDSNWPEMLLLLCATASTLIALTRQLPAQNVFLVASMIALIGSLAHVIGVKSGIPFGAFMFGADAGLNFANTLPWWLPLLWIVAVLNSRGVARLVLRPWRKTRAYGLWLIGLTALFTTLFDCALEPFAARLRHYWLWAAGGYSLTPSGAPISNAIGWFAVTLLMLAFATPVLINKQLSKRSPPNFQPLLLWLGGILVFAVSAAANGLWPVVAVDGLIAALVAGFAIRGGRW